MALIHELQKIISERKNRECRKDILKRCIDRSLQYDQPLSELEIVEIANQLEGIRQFPCDTRKSSQPPSDRLLRMYQNQEEYIFGGLSEALGKSKSKASVVVALSMAVEKIEILEQLYQKQVTPLKSEPSLALNEQDAVSKLQKSFELAIDNYILDNNKYDEFEIATRLIAAAIRPLNIIPNKDYIQHYTKYFTQCLIGLQEAKGLKDCMDLNRFKDDSLNLSLQNEMVLPEWLEKLHYHVNKKELETNIQQVLAMKSLVNVQSYDKVISVFIEQAEAYNAFIERRLTQKFFGKTGHNIQGQMDPHRIEAASFIKLSIIELLNNLGINDSEQQQLESFLREAKTITEVIQRFKEKINTVPFPDADIQKEVLHVNDTINFSIMYQQPVESRIIYESLIVLLENLKREDTKKSSIAIKSMINVINSAVICKIKSCDSLDDLIKHFKLLVDISNTTKNSIKSFSAIVDEIEKLFSANPNSPYLEDIKSVLNVFFKEQIRVSNFGYGLDFQLNTILKANLIEQYTYKMRTEGGTPKDIIRILKEMRSSLDKLGNWTLKLDQLKRSIVTAASISELITAIDVYMEARYDFIDKELGKDLSTKKLQLGVTSSIVKEAIKENRILSESLRECQNKPLSEIMRELHGNQARNPSYGKGGGFTRN